MRVRRVVPLRVVQQRLGREFFSLDIGSEEGFEPLANEVNSPPLKKCTGLPAKRHVQVRTNRADRRASALAVLLQ